MEIPHSMRERRHAERMLKRAQKRQAQAEKLVEKWRKKLVDLDRAGVARVQPRLWSEEPDLNSPSPSPQPDCQIGTD